MSYQPPIGVPPNQDKAEQPPMGYPPSYPYPPPAAAYPPQLGYGAPPPPVYVQQAPPHSNARNTGFMEGCLATLCCCFLFEACCF